jgi:hypothetical protein
LIAEESLIWLISKLEYSGNANGLDLLFHAANNKDKV